MKHLLRAVARSIARAARRDDGFGLIEVLGSAVIVAALGATVAQALMAGTHTSVDQRKRSQAAEVSQQDQQRLRGFSDTQLNDLSTPQVRAVSFDNTNFSVTSSAQFISATGGSSCGATGTGAAAYYDISSTTTWPGNARSAVVSRSLITPPAGGTLLTQVHDQNGAPLSGVGVTANGPAPAFPATGPGPVAVNDTTDTNGCTVFPALLSGTYSLTVADAGFVDPNGNLSPLTIPAVVTSVGTAGPSSGNPLVLGQAGLINATFNAQWSTLPIATNLAAQSADGISWYGSGTSTSMAAPKTGLLSAPGTPPQVCGGAQNTCTQANLFPASGTVPLFPFSFNPLTVPSYTSNYQVWAGGCQQMRPPAGTDMFTVAPGSNQTLAVQEPAINLQVSSNTTTPVRVQPAHVRFTFTSTTPAAPTCTETWTPAIAAGATPTYGSLANPGQPFVTSGAPASASGFTGALVVCADYKTGNNWHAYTTPATILNSNFAAATLVAFTIPTTGAPAQCP